MKISTLLKLMCCVLFGLSFLTVGSMTILKKSISERNSTIQIQLEYKDLVQQMIDSSDYLTNEVRAYVQFGEKEHYNNYWHEVNETKTRDNVIERLKELNTPIELLSLLEQAKNNSDSLIKLEEQAMNAVENGKLDLARQYVFGEDYDKGKTLIKNTTDEFKITLQELTDAKAASSYQKVKKFYLISLLLVLLLVISLTVSIIILLKKVGKPLTLVTKVANEVANGNLDIQPLNNFSKDEIAELSKSINLMVANLKNLISKMNDSSILIASSSEQLSASAEQSTSMAEQTAQTTLKTASDTEKQLEKLVQIASSIQDMSIGLHEISNNSDRMLKVTEQASEMIMNGNKTVTAALDHMKDISESTRDTTSIIQLLSERSKDIGKITSLITTISEQTNLLALNAAIEAARAGDHGKGFAVVANEVRKLAEESKKSAQQITRMVEGIQHETKKAINGMRKGNEKVASGLASAQTLHDVFSSINRSINNVAGKVNSVSSEVEQITSMSKEVVHAMEDIKVIAEKNRIASQETVGATQEQLSAMEEIAGSALSLSSLAEQLQLMITKFKWKEKR